jgi:hypothetical protein
MKQGDMMYSMALSRRHTVVCVDIVEAVRHGKKIAVPNGCDDDEARPGM